MKKIVGLNYIDEVLANNLLRNLITMILTTTLLRELLMTKQIKES